MSMQAIERIKLPKPDTHCFDTDTDSDVWSYSPELVRETVLTHIDKLEKLAEERLQNCAALVAEVERLRKDAERYRWIKSAKGLTLESERGGPWTRENGGTFTPSHRLCAGGTQFAPYETLDDAIDAAMKGTP